MGQQYGLSTCVRERTFKGFRGIGPLGGQRFAFTRCCRSEIFSRVACQLELLKLSFYTAAPHACNCKPPVWTPTRRRQLHRHEDAFVVWKPPVRQWAWYLTSLRHRRARRRHRHLAGRPSERGRQAGYSSTPHAAAPVISLVVPPGDREGRRIGGYGPIMAW